MKHSAIRACTRQRQVLERVSLYLTVPPSDLTRVRPLVRLLINQIGRRLTERMDFEEGRPTPRYRHRLLLMLDEFATLGRLEFFQTQLSYLPGYGIKAFLIVQDLSQLYAAYGRDESIVSNCDLRVAYAPNKVETARLLSDMAGAMTVHKETRTYTGNRLNPVLRGTKTGKPKRLPVSEDLRGWIERHVDRTGRLQRAPLFPNPRTGNRWPHKALYRVWNRAVAAAGLPHIGLYEGTKHSFATDAIRRGVPERHLQRFLGHASVMSTRRYARLADNAMLEVLRNPVKPAWRQAGDKGGKTQVPDFKGTSSWALLDSKEGPSCRSARPPGPRS